MGKMDLDMSRLKPEGGHYVVVGFVLPYHLQIPDDNYRVRVRIPEKELVVQVVVEAREQVLPDEMKKPVDNYTKRYLSRVLVYIPVRASDPATHGSLEAMQSAVFDAYEQYRAVAAQALNRLITAYRHATCECHTRAITSLEDFSLALLFNENSPEDATSHFRAYSKEYRITESILRIEIDIPPRVLEELKAELLTDLQPSLVDDLLLNAYYYLEAGNLRLAIIEAETAFEVAVTQFLMNHYRDAPEKVQTIRRTNSLTNLLQSTAAQEAFTARAKGFKKSDAAYRSWEESVWKVRGELVHGRISTVPYVTAARALGTVEETLEYLLERPRTPLRRYARYKLD